MEQKKIDRINELARKSKAEGLTQDEIQEQAQEMADAMRMGHGNDLLSKWFII